MKRRDDNREGRWQRLGSSAARIATHMGAATAFGFHFHLLRAMRHSIDGDDPRRAGDSSPTSSGR